MSPIGETILPDGCTEIVFHVADPFCRDGQPQPRSIFVGQMMNPTTVQPGRAVRSFGIRFEPAGAWGLFRISQSNLSGKIVEHTGLLSRAAERRILAADSMSERVHLAEVALGEIVPDHPDLWCVATKDVLARRLSLQALRRGSDVGVRQFERLFLTRVGLTPRVFGRLARFRQALDRRGAGWASIAADCGYCDQSHLIRDFRQFAGVPPTALREYLMSQSSNTASGTPV
jgi:AraC-like DNA-binding protein